MRRPRFIMNSIVVVAIALMVVAGALLPGALFAQQAESSPPSNKALFRRGAQLWPIYCAQCHKARGGGEFSPAQWDTIMMHMRSKANLTGDDTQAILAYLKGK